MNTLNKIYCRGMQIGFRIALPLLPYRKPELIDNFSQLMTILSSKNIQSILLVTGKSLRKRGLTKPLEDFLAASNILLTVYEDVVPNPTDINVEAARLLYLENKCQAIIGFGGGSPIDCAKAVGARIAKPSQSLGQMSGQLKIRKKIPTLIAIPTTAGTGSETTIAAVITDSATRHKYAINDFSLIPHYALLDPETTRSLPPEITSTTGMDALTHAVEAFIGRSTTRTTRRDSIEAVKLIFQNIIKAYENGNDMEARKNMLHASYLAGSAFTKSYVGYVHAVAHTLGGEYNIAHGLANAMLLPFVLEAYGSSAHKKLHQLAISIGISDEQDSHETGAHKFIEAVKSLKSDMNIGSFLPEIKKEDIPTLAKTAHKEGNPLYPVPKLMDAKELEQFYYKLMEV